MHGGDDALDARRGEGGGRARLDGDFVEFARPFRMPDFFLIAGLFLSSRIDGPWRLYIDRKVLHFAYFYVLWLTIQFAFKAPRHGGRVGWGGMLGEYLMRMSSRGARCGSIYHLALSCSSRGS